uniref:Choline transporter-like protein n=1 Tax=Trichuris muris TaxID=70415 RepID=A0A5S6QUJ6_TRIMR
MEYESAIAQVKVTDKRKCTNPVWCAIFILLWLLMFSFVVWGIVRGDYKRLHSGADDRGNLCGSKTVVNGTVSFELKKYMFPMDFRNPIDSLWICVEMCPNVTIGNRSMLFEFANKYNASLCDYHVPITDYEDKEKYPSSTKGPCPVAPIYKSKPILHRCSPWIEVSEGGYFALPMRRYEDYWISIGQDLSHASSTIGLMMFSALALYMIYVCILPCLNIILIKVFLVLLSFASFVLMLIFWVCYFQNKEHWYLRYTNLTTSTEEMVKFDRTDMMCGAIVFTIFTLVLCTATYFMWKYMPFINGVFKQARMTLFAMPEVILLPILNALTVMALVLLFGFTFVSTITIALSQMERPRILNVIHERAAFGSLNIPVAFLTIFYTCLLVWTCECLVNFQSLAISIPVATRLFNKDKRRKWCLVLTGITITLRYHLGSVVLGGAIVSTLRIIKTLLSLVESRMKTGKQRVAKCTFCLECITKFARISNKATMAVIAVEGSHYCNAASRAGALIGGNLGRFTTTYAMCTLYMSIGNFLISVTNAFIASMIFKQDQRINNYVTPTIAVGLLTCIAGEVFFSVFQTIISTLAICYCIIQTEAQLLRGKYFSHDQVSLYENMKDDLVDASNTDSLFEPKKANKQNVITKGNTKQVNKRKKSAGGNVQTEASSPPSNKSS